MPKARMLAGGVVEPGAGSPGAVLAYVAVSGGHLGSRLFRVEGPPNAPVIHELRSETTIDLSRFNRDTKRELQPAVEEIERLGGVSAIVIPKAEWICGEVRAHIKEREGIDVD
jgi:hypothetical protein